MGKEFFVLGGGGHGSEEVGFFRVHTKATDVTKIVYLFVMVGIAANDR